MAVEQRPIVEIRKFDVAKLELPAQVDFRLKADVAFGGFQPLGIPSRLSVDFQRRGVADHGEFEMVPLARLHQAAALGAGKLQKVAFGPLFQVHLVTGRKGFALGWQRRADVDARVVVILLASPPVELEHEVAVHFVGAQPAVAALQHQQSVFDAGLAGGGLPAVEIASVE